MGTAEIAPRIVDGEPICQRECPEWFGSTDHGDECSEEGVTCVRGLRRQRDALAAEVERLHHEIEHPFDASEFKELAEELDAARRELCKVRERLVMARDCLFGSERWGTGQAEDQTMKHIEAALSYYAPAPPATGTEEGGEG